MHVDYPAQIKHLINAIPEVTKLVCSYAMFLSTLMIISFSYRSVREGPAFTGPWKPGLGVVTGL